jgi:putative acetyltransferase
MTYLKRTDAADAAFQSLVVLLDKDLAARDGDEHAFYAQFNKTDHIHHVVVCLQDDIPVACGAFKPYDEQTVEIKRMFVLPEHRGKGLAAQVLKELETWAQELHFSACILETGKKQPEAISLYRKNGYQPMENYGPYKNVENSVCMKKKLHIVH